ncbi:WD40-repeat-containing domain protein [Glomus cerebriforme]|uniref:Pre-mRNA-processing factor 17 n=1 Tax=Glomus cerebriforme TaxID=658196 RepID=A0A397TH21_9GLOM|nr:WD40-repeat-containing domain protein [Glomus cerebriforme]
MDLLSAEYGSSGEDESTKISTKRTDHESVVSQNVKRSKIDLAPNVSLEDPKLSNSILIKPTDTQINVNIPYDDMMKPVFGPSNPYSTKVMNQNVLTGHVEEQVFSEAAFKTQQRTFTSFGYALDPSLITQSTGVAGAGLPKGDSAILEGENMYQGPWAGFEGENIGNPVGPPEGTIVTKAEAETKSKKEIDAGQEKTTFHGKSEYDYQGRTYMHVPMDLDVNLLGEPGTQECFIPKRCIHTWSGHNKGVTAIRFFPRSAHLILSSSMDTKVKIWDVYNDRRCLRTYMGHNKAVRDITFTNDGKRFLTASYDKYIKLWDTETGQCIKSFTTGKIPYVVKFNPDEDKQHIFLAGCSDKKIVQFDINTGEVTQEYDQHLGAVNTITFVDENRRFVTTSDDKTLRAWEFDIPVVIKYIAEPHMHSMPAVTLHPNKKWLACQSLDNQIVIYGAKDRFRIHRKKRFTGHLVAGYACQVNFSPDGRFIMSGDSEGSIWFWDWKSCKMLKKFKAHENVVIGCEWHPHETSKVATCSWDGLIKLWVSDYYLFALLKCIYN